MGLSRRQLPKEYLERLRDLEAAYLTETDPIRQSGFGGGSTRWRRERELILKAVDGDGDFLDVGCANGYLLECLVKWAKERGHSLVPYGVDYSARLTELAKRRFSQYASHFYVANAWDWVPPRRFRYVYTLFECFPKGYLFECIDDLIYGLVEKGGKLIIGSYGSSKPGGEPAVDITTILRTNGYDVQGSVYRGNPVVTSIAWIQT
jgi:SAM-dependent methyltransferase